MSGISIGDMGTLGPRAVILAAAFTLTLGLGTPAVRAQSLSYRSGQNVAPAYEGWEEDAQGNKWFLFGYMNRNWEEEVKVPIGPENGFNLGGADQGQPTNFLPRRGRFMFRVPVPKHFTEKDELIWTLTSKGRTEKAYATIRTDYKLDNVTKMSETGALGAGTSSPEIRANKPPTIAVQGNRTRTARVGQPLALTAVVQDDGIPKRRLPGLSGAAVSNEGSRRDRITESGTDGNVANPQVANLMTAPPRRNTVGKNVGLHVAWFQYRGPGRTTFSPEQIAAWEDTRAGANSPWAPIWIAPTLPADGTAAVTVTFDSPGTYVLRARADDGGLTSDAEVTVTVTN